MIFGLRPLIMSCCCKGKGKASGASVSCLGRCYLPKHKCLYKEDIRTGPVPRCMGWLYNAKHSPEHQLRCGWRPGHISCSVLKKIEQHNCSVPSPCSSKYAPPSCPKLLCAPPACTDPPSFTLLPSSRRPFARPSSCCVPSPPPCCRLPCAPGPPGPWIRIARHNGNYVISTDPNIINTAPSGPSPLKYVLNVEDNPDPNEKAKYSVEAKYNDYHIDYTCSQSSFVLDFTPPELQNLARHYK